MIFFLLFLFLFFWLVLLLLGVYSITFVFAAAARHNETLIRSYHTQYNSTPICTIKKHHTISNIQNILTSISGAHKKKIYVRILPRDQQQSQMIGYFFLVYFVRIVNSILGNVFIIFVCLFVFCFFAELMFVAFKIY